MDADFDLGRPINLNHNETRDQLQLDSKSRPFNYIWIPCSGKGTVVKVDTVFGIILGEYRTTPTVHGGGDPSRTTVDHDGSVWLSNRKDVYEDSGQYYGSVVHIGLDENNQCHDRNGDGLIQTSTGSVDILNWTTANVSSADDECIVHYTKVNSQGTRHVSVDKENNVWVSGIDLQNFDLVKGGRFDEPDSGSITRSELSVRFGGYGGLVDPEGVIWSSGKGPLMRWDPVGNLTEENRWYDPTESKKTLARFPTENTGRVSKASLHTVCALTKKPAMYGPHGKAEYISLARMESISTILHMVKRLRRDASSMATATFG